MDKNLEKEARDKFDEEGGEASQSYTILHNPTRQIQGNWSNRFSQGNCENG